MRYIHELPDWPKFSWDQKPLAIILASTRLRQGRLIGRLESLGLLQREEAVLKTLTEDVVRSCEIEGENLDLIEVRSSIARKLGMDVAGLVHSDRRVDGIVKMTIDATQHYNMPLTVRRLLNWHKALFPGVTRGFTAGEFRNDSKGPMQVVAGAVGRERVHFEAPAARRIETELSAFLDRVNQTGEDPVLKAALAHLWFVTIHPFDDGNGRIARAIADWALARAENSPRRFYSMSAQIRRERKAYYDILERTQRGTLDITEWMGWFLGCLDRAVAGAEAGLSLVFQKDRFWKTHIQSALNIRQQLILNMLLEGTFVGKLTSSKWAKISKCSQDTAYRDIIELAEKGILVKDTAGGRSTSYSLITGFERE